MRKSSRKPGGPYRTRKPTRAEKTMSAASGASAREFSEMDFATPNVKKHSLRDPFSGRYTTAATLSETMRDARSYAAASMVKIRETMSKLQLSILKATSETNRAAKDAAEKALKKFEKADENFTEVSKALYSGAEKAGSNVIKSVQLLRSEIESLSNNVAELSKNGISLDESDVSNMILAVKEKTPGSKVDVADILVPVQDRQESNRDKLTDVMDYVTTVLENDIANHLKKRIESGFIKDVALRKTLREQVLGETEKQDRRGRMHISKFVEAGEDAYLPSVSQAVSEMKKEIANVLSGGDTAKAAERFTDLTEDAFKRLDKIFSEESGYLAKNPGVEKRDIGIASIASSVRDLKEQFYVNQDESTTGTSSSISEEIAEAVLGKNRKLRITPEAEEALANAYSGRMSKVSDYIMSAANLSKKEFEAVDNAKKLTSEAPSGDYAQVLSEIFSEMVQARVDNPDAASAYEEVHKLSESLYAVYDLMKDSNDATDEELEFFKDKLGPSIDNLLDETEKAKKSEDSSRRRSKVIETIASASGIPILEDIVEFFSSRKDKQSKERAEQLEQKKSAAEKIMEAYQTKVISKKDKNKSDYFSKYEESMPEKADAGEILQSDEESKKEQKRTNSILEDIREIFKRNESAPDNEENKKSGIIDSTLGYMAGAKGLSMVSKVGAVIAMSLIPIIAGALAYSITKKVIGNKEENEREKKEKFLALKEQSPELFAEAEKRYQSDLATAEADAKKFSPVSREAGEANKKVAALRRDRESQIVSRAEKIAGEMGIEAPTASDVIIRRDSDTSPNMGLKIGDPKRKPEIIVKDGVNFEGLHPNIKQGLFEAAKEMAQNGKVLRITSGLRSRAEQTELFEAYKSGKSKYPAASPGSSPHESGLAFDIDKGNIPAFTQTAAFKNYFDQPLPGNDPIHFVFKGAKLNTETEAVAQTPEKPEVPISSVYNKTEVAAQTPENQNTSIPPVYKPETSEAKIDTPPVVTDGISFEDRMSQIESENVSLSAIKESESAKEAASAAATIIPVPVPSGQSQSSHSRQSGQSSQQVSSGLENDLTVQHIVLFTLDRVI